MSISKVNGGEVITVEGQYTEGSQPPPKAWDEVGVSEFRDCQLGQIMKALALLNENPNHPDKR